MIRTLIGIPIFFLLLHFALRNSKKVLGISVFILGIFLIIGVLVTNNTQKVLQDIDMLRLYYLLLLVLPLSVIYFSKKKKTEKSAVVFAHAMVSLGLFLASASSGRDFGTVINVSPFFLPVFIASFSETISYKKAVGLVAILIAFHTLFINFNALNLFGNVYGVYPRSLLTREISIPSTKYIKVNKADKYELEYLTAVVKKQTSTTDRIFCFPYCPMMYVLTERRNASYYSFFYFEVFMAKDQDQVIEQLRQNKPKLVLLQKKGPIEQEALYENERLHKLVSFITKNYKKVDETRNFVLYH
jgi:hypothetical protein